MKISSINYGNQIASSITSLEVAKENLEKLAIKHNTTVEELIESAKSAGDQALAYQVRALNLYRRIQALSH